ncbi:MAG: methyl-accepting chemotaxis protein [Oscillospiraceae bacterium]|nr:methyl-accepting chemotaxis protein [Oscillospiraceae bacterium]
MKNMKVAQKLILSFVLVAIFATAVGLVGIFGMSTINTGASNMYENQTVPMSYMTTIVEMIQRERACMREFIIGAAIVEDPNDRNDPGIALIEDAHDRAVGYRERMAVAKPLYRETISTTTAQGLEALKLFDEAVTLYDTRFSECVEAIYNGAKDGENPSELYDLMRTYTDDINTVTDNFEDCLNLKIDAALTANEDGDAMFSSMLTIIIIVLVVAVAISMVLAIYISGIISNPLKALSAFMIKAGTTGDITLSATDEATISAFATAKDEVGQTISAAAAFVKHVQEISDELETVAHGDLTSEIHLLSDVDVMGKSLRQMIASLNDMFANINTSTQQVSTGAKQVADGAQSLAQGSTEQAASVQELSASISEIAESTKSNADTATKAARLSGTIKENAEKGSHQMDEMITAVKDINDASQSISKIIKTIDDIAFQTNILALNAAVEAARAGQHGKGFAVVAEEVRNLASKSAEAAKDTGNMIQNSMEKAELGSQIAGETATSLKEIVTGISESTEMIQEIAKSSEEQSLGISHINTGIDQVAQVVQQNSATAQQSAAASQQMSSQSTMLEELISQFKLKDSDAGLRSLPTSSKSSAPSAPAPRRDYDNLGDDSFGKY